MPPGFPGFVNTQPNPEYNSVTHRIWGLHPASPRCAARMAEAARQQEATRRPTQPCAAHARGLRPCANCCWCCCWQCWVKGLAVRSRHERTWPPARKMHAPGCPSGPPTSTGKPPQALPQAKTPMEAKTAPLNGQQKAGIQIGRQAGRQVEPTTSTVRTIGGLLQPRRELRLGIQGLE